MSNKKSMGELKIAISGKSGCGNTTVSRMLADTLELRFINFTFRALAQEKGLELSEVLILSSFDDYWDKEVDSRQVKMAREKGGCVLGSRLAIWMLPEADLKVYLTASPETRARRIMNREGGDLEKIARFTAERDRQDSERYLHLYNIDNNDYSLADLVIETDNIGPEEILKMVLERLEQDPSGP